jgi:hypothetical protein
MTQVVGAFVTNSRLRRSQSFGEGSTSPRLREDEELIFRRETLSRVPRQWRKSGPSSLPAFIGVG